MKIYLICVSRGNMPVYASVSEEDCKEQQKEYTYGGGTYIQEIELTGSLKIWFGADCDGVMSLTKFQLNESDVNLLDGHVLCDMNLEL